MGEFIIAYGKDIFLVLGGIVAYFVGGLERKTRQKKAEVEIQGGELRNLSETFDIYEKLLKNLEAKLEEANEDFAKLRVVNKQTMTLLQLCKEDKDALAMKNAQLAAKNAAIMLQLRTCSFKTCSNYSLYSKINTEES